MNKKTQLSALWILAVVPLFLSLVSAGVAAAFWSVTSSKPREEILVSAFVNLFWGVVILVLVIAVAVSAGFAVTATTRAVSALIHKKPGTAVAVAILVSDGLALVCGGVIYVYLRELSMT